jgi:hypothetical protein
MAETSIENIYKIYSELFDKRYQGGSLGDYIRSNIGIISLGKAVHEGNAISTVKGIEDIYVVWDDLCLFCGVEDTGFECWEDIVEAEVTVFEDDDDEDQDGEIFYFPIK